MDPAAAAAAPVVASKADVDSARTMLIEIKDQLAAKDTAALNKTCASLRQILSPMETMRILVPHLFQAQPNEQDHFTNHEALLVLDFLVSSSNETDVDAYLKVASRAIRDEAERLVRDASSAFHEIHVSDSFLDVVVAQLCQQSDLHVAENATATLTSLCHSNRLTESILTKLVEAWRSSLQNVTTDRSRASTSSVRCATTMTEIILLNDHCMKAAMSTGATTLFVQMLSDDRDPLVQTSMLDLLESLAEHQPVHHDRAHWLMSDAVLHPVLRLAGGLVQEEDLEPDTLLGGPALRVVASICRFGQKNETAALFGIDSAALVQCFHRALHNFQVTGETDRLALVSSISSLSSASPTALTLLLDDPVTREAWLSLSVAQPKLKSAILVSVAHVLDPVTRVDAAGDTIPVLPISDQLGIRLYTALGQTNGADSTDLVLSLTRSSLPELRLGAYTLLEAVAKLPTGGQVLFMNGEFYDFLINRSYETTNEGREARFAVVKAVLNSKVKGLLAEDIVRQLETYVSQGPHFVKALQWEVAER